LDATAAHTLGTLVQTLSSRGLWVVISGVSPEKAAIRRLLHSHNIIRARPLADPAKDIIAAMRDTYDIIYDDPGLNTDVLKITSPAPAHHHHRHANYVGDDDSLRQFAAREGSAKEQSKLLGGKGDNDEIPLAVEFASLDHALDWCEEALLQYATSQSMCQPAPTSISLQATLRAVIRVVQERRLVECTDSDAAAMVTAMCPYFTSKSFHQPGEVIFRVGENPDQLFMVEHGKVELYAEGCARDSPNSTQSGLSRHSHVRLIYRYGPGSFFSKSAFFAQPSGHSYTARTLHPGTVVQSLHISALRELTRRNPFAVALFQTSMLAQIGVDHISHLSYHAESPEM